MQQPLRTSSGTIVKLAAQLGRGGEGTVYALPKEDQCVKIYHKALDPDRAEKIRWMAANSNDLLRSVSSWPADLILDSKGVPFGLVMPRVVGRKDVHELYSPKSRRSEFLRADWRFLIRASQNIARAFAALHQAGLVIGDVNHGSILVAQDARVTLVDCDSFQIEKDGRRFLCEKGVETYTPPELQGKSFIGVTRTTDHDNFGLAILIWHLLMMGRHPFAGRYSGVGDMPIAKAIEERRFAYGPKSAQVQMERPPGSPELAILGKSCSDLFIRAFTTNAIGGRPKAKEWLEELGQLERNTTQCKANEAHWHLTTLSECPWCKMERTTGTVLFPYVTQIASSGTLDVLAFTQRVYALPQLGPPPAILKPSVSPSSAILESRKATRRSQAIGWIVALTGAVICLFLGSVFFAVSIAVVGFVLAKALRISDPSFKAAEAELKDAREAWETLYVRYQKECVSTRGHAARGEFDGIKKRWDQIPSDRTRRLDDLKTNMRKHQLEMYLDKFKLEQATISGVGPGRKAILASEGIETALDIQETKLFIPSFGPATRAKILAWRRGLEASFVFDAMRAIDPSQIATVEQAILAEKRGLETRMRLQGDIVLLEHAKIVDIRKQMQPRMEAAMAALAQAEANFKAVS